MVMRMCQTTTAEYFSVFRFCNDVQLRIIFNSYVTLISPCSNAEAEDQGCNASVLKTTHSTAYIFNELIIELTLQACQTDKF